MAKLARLLIPILVIGCAHKVQLKNFDVPQSSLRGIEGKRLAVILDPSQVQDEFTIKKDVHTFQFQEIQSGLKHAIQQHLDGKAAEVEFFQSAKNASQFDLYLYPTLTLETYQKGLILGCLAKYRVEVKNAQQKYLASAKGEGDTTYFFAMATSKNCQKSLGMIFDEVTTKALRGAVNPHLSGQ